MGGMTDQQESPNTGADMSLIDQKDGKLHIYSNGSDIVIAYSAEDAKAILTEVAGPETSQEYSDWELEADDEDEYGFRDDPDDESKSITRKASEWIALKGRGYMGSYDA
jgi:hypothetical protein